jgi:signal transduction histidine kinase
MKKILLLFIFLTNIFAINILILNSYSPVLKWTAIQTHTLIDELQSKIKDATIFVEDLDTKRFRPTPQRYQNYLIYLKNKYKNIQFDIVIVTDDNALNFIRDYKNEKIFKKAKIFFEGINNLSLSQKLDKHKFAGVFERKNPLSNLEIAKKINPNLKTIYVVSDNSTSGNKTIRQYENAFKYIKGINFIYLNSSSLEKIINVLKNYDKNSVLMLLTFGSMRYHNKPIDVMQVPVVLSKYYPNPIIVHTDIYINIPHTNIIGGDCTDAKQQAKLNVEKLIQYINHTPMEKIGFILKNANTIYLNVKNLSRFGINAKDLKIPNAVLVNKPTSLYEIYKVEIISTLIIFIIIIIFLILLANKNRQINKLNKNLEQKIKKAIEENRKQEQLLFQQSKLAAMGEMIGAIAHQWRQPLNSLALHTQLLVEDFLDNKVDEEYLYKYEKNHMDTIQFMSKTIDDFRNFFAKDKEKTKFYLKDAVLEVVQLLDKQLMNHHIFISVNYDESEIVGYKNELKQVILNVINNAKDAVLANNIEKGKIDIEIKDKIIYISDNAGGIPEKIQNRIFEPYFTTKGTKGTGIGLYMSKIIIEEHLNGKIYFENIENGTKFIIDLKDANENK